MGTWKYEVIHDYNGSQLIKEFREENPKLKNSKGSDDDEIDFIVYAEKDDFTISLGRVLLIKMSDAMIQYYYQYKGKEVLEKYWAKFVYNQQKNNLTFQFKEDELANAFLEAIKLQAKGISGISVLEAENYIKRITDNISEFLHEDLKFSREQWDPTLKSDRYLFAEPEKAVDYFDAKCNSLIEELNDLKAKLELIRGFEVKTSIIADLTNTINNQIKNIQKFKSWLIANKDSVKLKIPYICGVWNGLIAFVAGIVDIVLLGVNIVVSEFFESDINLETLLIKESIEEILSAVLKDPFRIIDEAISSIKNYKYSRYDDPSLNQYQKQYNEGEDTILAIDIVITIVTIIKGIAKLAKQLSKFTKWIDEVLARNGRGALKAEEVLRDAKRIELFSKIIGKPISKKLLKELQDEFKKLGGELLYDDESFRYVASREKIYNESIEGITYNEELIFLNKNVTTSGVYEELIHAKQHRVGRFKEAMEKYKNNVLVINLMEKEAAEELLENAVRWKLPQDEVKLIKERLEFFNNELKKLGYEK